MDTGAFQIITWRLSIHRFAFGRSNNMKKNKEFGCKKVSTGRQMNIAVRGRKSLLGLFLLTAFLIISSFAVSAADGDLAQQFKTPPEQTQPWVYWVWLADTTPAALTRDLEQMKAKGITGCILYDVQTGRGVNWWDRTVVRDGNDYRTVKTDDYRNPYYPPVPMGPLESWSPHWRELVCLAAGEAGRLGIDFVVSDGLANTSGNISEEYGEQKLAWSETSVQGNQTFEGKLPEPPSIRAGEWRYHRDVAVL